MQNTKAVSVKVPAEEYQLLKKHAERVARTITQVVARAIRSYCSGEAK